MITGPQQAALYWARKRRRGRANAQSIDLAKNTILASAANGDPVGRLAVLNGSGTYTFTLTLSAGGLFAIDVADLEKNGALVAGTSYSITVSADNGVDTPISQSFMVKAL